MPVVPRAPRGVPIGDSAREFAKKPVALAIYYFWRACLFSVCLIRGTLLCTPHARAHLDAHARTARRVFTVGFGVPPSALFRLDDFAV